MRQRWPRSTCESLIEQNIILHAVDSWCRTNPGPNEASITRQETDSFNLSYVSVYDLVDDDSNTKPINLNSAKFL